MSEPKEELIEMLIVWIDECGSEFTVKSMQILQEFVNNLMSSENEEIKKYSAKINELNEKIKNTKSNEQEPTFQQLFSPCAVDIDGFTMTLPNWMFGADFNYNILSKDFLEIPSQLMYCEREYLTRILPKDYYIYIYENTRENSNISIYLHWTERISQWVAYSILIQKNEQIRVVAINNLIQIALKCLEVHNFNSFIKVIDGLTHYSVQRLTKTWDFVPKGDKELLQKLIVMKSKILYTDYSFNFEKPCIPCVGLLFFVMMTLLTK